MVHIFSSFSRSDREDLLRWFGDDLATFFASSEFAVSIDVHTPMGIVRFERTDLPTGALA